MIISQGYIYWGDGILPESRHQCVTHQVESGFHGIGYKQRELLRHPRIHNLCEVESQSQQLDEHRDHKWSRLTGLVVSQNISGLQPWASDQTGIESG